MKPILICVDSPSLFQPEIIGLSGESLTVCEWLEPCASGEQARSMLRNSQEKPEAIWVLSSDDIYPINLAAQLKADHSTIPVTYVVSEVTGSVLSRSQCARIDATITYAEFRELFVQEKQRRRPTDSFSSDGRPSLAGLPLIDTGVSAPATDGTQLIQVPSIPQVALETPPITPYPVSSVTNAPAQTQAMPMVSPSSLSPVARSAPSSGGASKALILPVLSASGGTGKSTASLLLAMLCAQFGRKTLLIDCDFQYGDISFLMGQPQVPSVMDLLQGKDVPSDATQVGENLHLVTAPALVEESENLQQKMPAVLESVERSYDVIVANTSSHWSDTQMALLDRCTAAVFLMDQRSVSIRSCQQAIELCGRCGVATNSLIFILNKCNKNSLISSMDVSCALKGASVFELKDGGREVEEMLGSGLVREFMRTRNELNQTMATVFGQAVVPLFSGAGQTSVPLSSPSRARKRRNKRREGRDRGAA